MPKAARSNATAPQLPNNAVLNRSAAMLSSTICCIVRTPTMGSSGSTVLMTSAVHDAEYRGIRTDARREGEEGDRREAGAPAEQTKAELHIASEIHRHDLLVNRPGWPAQIR
jgi:hypothetical protein